MRSTCTIAAAHHAIRLVPLLMVACTPVPSHAPPGSATLTLRLDAKPRALQRIGDEDRASGDLTRRRDVVAGLNRSLLMSPPDDLHVPEMFDLVTAMAPRMTAREISPQWAAYIYTSYQRDLINDRPGGVPPALARRD